MGYRFYLYTVSKDELDKIKDKTYKELAELHGEVTTYSNGDIDYYFSPNHISSVKSFHELGAYLDNKLYEGLYKGNIGTFFSNEDTIKEITEEHDLGFLDATGFKVFLEAYKEKVLEVLKNMLKDDSEIENEWRNETSAEKLKKDCEEKISWIERNHTYNLNLESNNIQDSWLYEYAIFDLIHWYKIIDWEKQLVMFYAY